MNKHYDVIVIGAGVAGVSTAAHLQRQGHSVLLIDKKGIAKETSYGNAGIIDTGYVLPFLPPPLTKIPKILLGAEPSARINLPGGLKTLPWIAAYYMQSTPNGRNENGKHLRPLVENAVLHHKELLKNTDGVKHLSNFGRAKIFRTEKAFKNAASEILLLEQYGIKSEIHDPAAFKEIEPDIKPNFFKAITNNDSARYTNPSAAINAIAQYFAGQGGDILIEDVIEIAKMADLWRINEKHTAKHIVICAGPWTNTLLKPLGHKFPIALKRGYHKHYKSPTNLSHAYIDVEIGYAICPMEQGVRITTGAEFATRNAPPNPIQLSQVLPYANDFLQIDGAIDDTAWLGARPCTPDSRPIIGQSNRHQGLWFNFAHGHIGLTAGPSTGKLLAQMITGEKTLCDPAPYSPDRF